MVSTRSGSKRLVSQAKISDFYGPVAKKARTNVKFTPAQVATPALPENDPVVEQFALSVEDEDADDDDYENVSDWVDNTNAASDSEYDEELKNDGDDEREDEDDDEIFIDRVESIYQGRA